MININDYMEEKSCIYKGEEFLVRDNGAVLRKSRPNQRVRKHDNVWTFGAKNQDNGYSFFFGDSQYRIHQIVATAFLGARSSKEYIVDHIDTNRQNNRPNNLRWITREENVLNNELTRRKIEYCTGVSAEEFLRAPKKYRAYLNTSNVSYMRPVNEAEATAYSKNIEKLGRAKRKPLYKNSSNVEDWIYKIRDPYVKLEAWKREQENIQRNECNKFK